MLVLLWVGYVFIHMLSLLLMNCNHFLISYLDPSNSNEQQQMENLHRCFFNFYKNNIVLPSLLDSPSCLIVWYLECKSCSKILSKVSLQKCLSQLVWSAFFTVSQYKRNNSPKTHSCLVIIVLKGSPQWLRSNGKLLETVQFSHRLGCGCFIPQGKRVIFVLIVFFSCGSCVWKEGVLACI